MNNYLVVNKNIAGCENGIMILMMPGRCGVPDLFTVGANFGKYGISKFACSPEYRTINGAIRFAQKHYSKK